MSKRLEIEKVANLTPLQEGMLFHTVMEPESQAYYEQVRITIRGVLNLEALQKSFQTLVQRHESLRSNIYYKSASRARLIVFKEREATLRYENLTDISEVERAEAVRKYADTARNDRYDLSKDLLVRLTVLQTRTNAYTLLLSFHHIIMDGWCLGIVKEELFGAYEALKAEKPVLLPRPHSFTDYARWLDKQDKDAAKEHWRSLLDGYDRLAVLPTLPVARTLQADAGYSLCKNKTPLAEETTRQLRTVAERNGATLSSLFLAAWGVVLGGYNQSEDVVFGTVVSGRPPALKGVEQMLGLFINTIPVRIKLEAEQSFSQLLRVVQRMTVQSQTYDYCSLAEIQSQSALKQQLLDHFVVFENYPFEDMIGQSDLEERLGFIVEDVHLYEETPYHFNIEVEDGKALNFILSYNSHVYSDEAMTRLAGHLEHVLVQIAHTPEILLRDILLLTATEETELTKVWNGPVAEYPAGTLHEIFEAQAERIPEQIAVIYEETALTYRELNDRSNRLARTLRSHGVTTDRLVGLMADRSVDMIVGILGILKSGGAYVPIDPAYPEERIRYMLDDSGADLLLTQNHLVENVAFDGKILVLSGEPSVYHKDGSNLEPVSGPNALAYMIYTSGTTGQPKGVMIEQDSVSNLVHALAERVYSRYDQPLQVAWLSAYVFDASVQQIFASLLLGHTLHIVSREVSLNGEQLIAYYRKQQIDLSDGTPAHLYILSETISVTESPGVRHFLIGGEALQVQLVNGFLCKWSGYHPAITNVYGPTETTVDATAYTIEDSEDLNVLLEKGVHTLSIGTPLANESVYILDAHHKPVPIGVGGELYISGAGVARGYLNRVELTAEKFVANPFADGEIGYERMYRTGDLARWMPDGNIEFLGRIDHQVKIRGYRIELGEVESQLLKVERVREAVVISRADETGQMLMVAYYVAAQEIGVAELRRQLVQKIPSYMVPSYFVQLERMPLSPNGKIDRKALPAPEGSLQSGVEHIAARTWVESKLAQIWQDVLGLMQVGVKENFFEIGGHSLRAMTLVSKIHKELNKLLPLRSIFEAPTIEQLAAVIESMDQVAYASIPVTEERAYYPLSSAQKRMYVLHRIDPDDVNYNMPAVIQVSGLLDVKRVEEAFRQIILRHATLRTSFELVNGEPMQRIQDTVPFEVEYMKIEEQTVTDVLAIEAKIETLVRAFVRSFNLQAAPLLRVALVDLAVQKIDEEPQHLLMVDMHHIISDGVSTGVLTNEFVQLYSGKELSPLRIQYKDYAVWQQSEAQQDWMKRQEAYWLNTFQGELPVLDLPTNFVRPAVRSTSGDTVMFGLESEVSERLKELAAQTGSTLYIVLLAAYTALLYQYTGQKDIIVGTPIAGRPHADLEPIIGMFVGTLALRNYPTAEQTFRSYVEDVKTRALQAYEHQDYPFETLVDQLNVKRDMSRNPLFDTMFVLQNTEQSELKLKDLSFRPYEMEQTPAKFDLKLEASEEEAGIQFGLQYATTLYQRETIEQITRHFVRLAEAIAANPDTTLGELEWITLQETVHVLKAHQDRKKASRYWGEYLGGYEEQVRLPQAKMSGKAGHQAERLDFDLGASLTAGIQQIAQRDQVTISTLVQTVWGILLQKYNGTDDVVFGNVVLDSTSDMQNAERKIGLSLLNPVPVRITSNEGSLFSDVMKQNQEKSRVSLLYSTYLLDDIQALTELKQDLINHRIIFAIASAKEQMEQRDDGRQASFSIAGIESVETTSYDFNLLVRSGETIQTSFCYNARVFGHESIEQIQGHLLQLLEQVVANPDIRVHELDVVTESEREQIVGIWGDTSAEYPREQTIHELFEAQAAQTPEQAALFFEGEQLTYRELNERANRLARTLRSLGVTTDRLVGLMTERSVDMVVGIFAILKAGGAYVPLDPTYPEERIRYMLNNSGADILLTQSRLAEKVAFDGKVLILDGEQAESATAAVNALFTETQAATSSETTQNRFIYASVYHEDGSNLEPVSGSNDLAYVIYTSGTTGQPKGVMVEHRGLCNLKTYFDQTLHIGLSDHTLLFASYSFDVACWEIFQALFCGATLYVPTMGTILDYQEFEQYIAEHRITVLMLPPTYAVYLEPGRMPNLRILLTAGSAATTELVNKWKDWVVYYNAYGPTEDSIITSIWSLPEDSSGVEVISIGRPVPNHRVYVVDVHGHLAPVGVAGELCVSGDGLARGYLHRPELTDEKFIPNPFADGEAGYERMYRTGDLARWTPDGNIEHLGRIDHQVKIRGYRIELGEVEASMLKVEKVQEVIVLAHEDEQGQHQLVAYYVAEQEVSAGELRRLLSEKLPNYMVPSFFVQLEHMPLTPNGKIDRKALPVLEWASHSDMGYVAPRNEVEQQLAHLWQAVLGVEKVGIDDNFFELGGHSLKAIQLVSKAQESGILLGIHQVLQHQTIRILSDLLSVDEVDSKQDTGITDFVETEQWISETFGVQAMIELVAANERNYLLLHVHPFRADQVDEIAATISSHVHPDLHPHYIVPMGKKDASQMLRTGHTEIEQTDEEQENSLQRQAEEWIPKIAKMNAHWNENILSTEVIHRFLLASAQHYHLLHPASSGTVIRLDRYVDVERLSTAVRQLIHRHELLRSVLVQSDGVWQWEVRSTPENISVPRVDLSAYPVQTQQQLLSSIMSNLYFEPYEQTQSLQYRMLLVHLNLREHLLLLPCSHIIFDGTSGVVLHSQLLEAYDHTQQAETTETLHYRDYVDHIRQGPREISDQQIVEQFKLQSFEDNNSRIHERTRECNNAESTQYIWELRIHDIPTRNGAVSLWDISLQMAFQFFSSYFYMSEVPLWMTQYGRQYGERNYFGSVGEFIDHIPVLLQKEGVTSYENDIQRQLDVTATHHLNFLNLIFNEELEQAYPQSSSLLKKGFEQLPIVFNYLGEMREDLNMLSALNTRKEQAGGGKVIFFESTHTESVLQITLLLPYKENSAELHRIFQAANDKILSDLIVTQ